MTNNLNVLQKFLVPYYQWSGLYKPKTQCKHPRKGRVLKQKEIEAVSKQKKMEGIPTQKEVEEVFQNIMKEKFASGSTS
jgi:hypothetical protein